MASGGVAGTGGLVFPGQLTDEKEKRRRQQQEMQNALAEQIRELRGLQWVEMAGFWVGLGLVYSRSKMGVSGWFGLVVDGPSYHTGVVIGDDGIVIQRDLPSGLREMVVSKGNQRSNGCGPCFETYTHTHPYEQHQATDNIIGSLLLVWGRHGGQPILFVLLRNRS